MSRFSTFHVGHNLGKMIDEKKRTGIIVDEKWCSIEDLINEGLNIEKTLLFNELYFPYFRYPNKAFLFGVWHEKSVVISYGKQYLFESQLFQNNNTLRCWMGFLFSCMNGANKLIDASCVLKVGDVELNSIVYPTIVSGSHLQTSFLDASQNEFVDTAKLLSNQKIPFYQLVFDAAKKSDFNHYRIQTHGTSHLTIQGPGLPNEKECRIWGKKLFYDTVSMDIDPELRLTAAYNLDHENDPIQVLPLLFTGTDNTSEIMKPSKNPKQLAKLLSLTLLQWHEMSE